MEEHNWQEISFEKVINWFRKFKPDNCPNSGYSWHYCNKCNCLMVGKVINTKNYDYNQHLVYIPKFFESLHVSKLPNCSSVFLYEVMK